MASGAGAHQRSECELFGRRFRFPAALPCDRGHEISDRSVIVEDNEFDIMRLQSGICPVSLPDLGAAI